MKRITIIISFIVCYFTCAYCGTNILVGKGCSTDGSTLCTYSVDSYYLYGELDYHSKEEHSKYSKIDIYGWDTRRYQGKVDQVPETASVLGNMNEYQVCITESTWGGRAELIDTSGVLDYGNLIRLTLQRSKNATEAIQIMTELVEEYGYCSSGETFTIADPNQIWIMEMIGKGPDIKGAVWVAQRVPDDHISVHANHSRITSFPMNDRANCRYSKDVISFAREKGYFTGKNKDFSFSDAYDPMSFSARRFCDARVWSVYRKLSDGMDKYLDYILGKSDERLPLWIKPNKKISLHDLKELMRDKFEETPLSQNAGVGGQIFDSPVRFAPREWEIDGVKYFNENPIAGPQNAFSFVAQMRNNLPNMVGGVLWYGVDDATFTVYIPLYCGITHVPKCFTSETGSQLRFSWDSAYWVFNWVSNMVYYRYSLMAPDVIKQQQEIEKKLEDNLEVVEEAAKSLYNKSPEYAARFLTEYSENQSYITMSAWKSLGEFLLVKFCDGGVKRERKGKFIDNGWGVPEKISFPGYSDWFYKQIINESGDKYKLPTEK